MSFLFPTYQRFPLELVKGEGTHVIDQTGKEYLDFTSGIGVTSFGHGTVRIKKAIEEQLSKIWHTSNLFESSLQEEVAKKLIPDASYAVYFANSGAEANEAALKLARKATGRDGIVSFQNSFHGRTFGAMTATGQPKIQDGFGTLLPHFTYGIYNDGHGLAELITAETAAVMLEIIQGEGGVQPAETAWLLAVAQQAKQVGALLIIDEIQTGIGRTGKKFAYQYSGLEPDIITVAKALGNGLPIGAMIGKQTLAEAFGYGSHGSTFGGNPVALSAATVVLDLLHEPGFLEEVQAKGDYFRTSLEQNIAKSPYVEAIRGEGLMLGIVMKAPLQAQIETLQSQGLLVLTAGKDRQVLRILPPLTVSYDELDQAVAILEDTLLSVKIGE
ncbi:acetylornithine transaminase [Listeria costaricensis]|uniref:acetylornithine transaminase n=1 Tax=Listeria costaricensis TaxID=2026604 RepID=UPI000C080CFA|nr:acetylornithine transaminase [Listeria costaricensis]